MPELDGYYGVKYTCNREGATVLVTTKLIGLIGNDADPDVALEVLSEARAVRLEMQVDKNLVDANSVDLLSNELKKSGEMDRDVLSKVGV